MSPALPGGQQQGAAGVSQASLAAYKQRLELARQAPGQVGALGRLGAEGGFPASKSVRCLQVENQLGDVHSAHICACKCVCCPTCCPARVQVEGTISDLDQRLLRNLIAALHRREASPAAAAAAATAGGARGPSATAWGAILVFLPTYRTLELQHELLLATGAAAHCACESVQHVHVGRELGGAAAALQGELLHASSQAGSRHKSGRRCCWPIQCLCRRAFACAAGLPFAFFALHSSIDIDECVVAMQAAAPGRRKVGACGWCAINSCCKACKARRINQHCRVARHMCHCHQGCCRCDARAPPSTLHHAQVILATNIAESSVTIPGVMVVIDCCRTLEMRWER